MTDEEGAHARVSVLVVDDEPAICQALELALRRAGYEPIVALDSESALAALHCRQVDVLLLDLRMPEPRGDSLFHLATAIQPQLARHSLFITGDVSERAATLIRGCGIPFLYKPFDLDALLQAVVALAPRRRDVAS